MRKHLERVIEDGTIVPFLGAAAFGLALACAAAAIGENSVQTYVFGTLSILAFWVLGRTIKAGPSMPPSDNRLTFGQRVVAGLLLVMIAGAVIWPLELILNMFGEMFSLYWSIDSLLEKGFILVCVGFMAMVVTQFGGACLDDQALKARRQRR